MILSHEHKFIFICNGKTGTTSLEAALQPYQEGADFDFEVPGLFVPKHIPPALLRSVLPEEVWSTYFTFAFVRNPWDLFVSNWFHNRAGSPSGPGGEPSRRTQLHRRLRAAYRRPRRSQIVDQLRSAYTETLGRAKKHSGRDGEPAIFSPADVDYLFSLLRQDRGLPGADGYYQSSWVYDVDGTQLVDFVGRFENLEADVRHLADRIGIDIELPHLNRTTHAEYRAHFDDTSRRRVADLWQVDIRNFGYEF